MTPTKRDGTTPLDPDRRRPPPPHPGFAALDIDLAIDVCRRCRCLVPATEWARIRHVEYEQTVQLSGSVEASTVPRLLPPDPDPTSGGVDARGARQDLANPTGTAATAPPDSKMPPAPPQDTPPGGVEGANQPKPGAGLLPGAAPPGPVPPGPGGTQDSRPGDNRGRAPGREPTPDEAEQAAYEAWLNEQATQP